MKTVIKTYTLFTLKYLVGISLLIWLFIKINLVEIVNAVKGFSIISLIVIVLLALLNLSVQFYRWRYLITHHSSEYEPTDLLPSFFAGFAFRMMIPGGHAEITKIFLLPGKKSGKVLAFGMEKYFETYIKFVLVLMALPVIFDKYRHYLWVGAILGLAAYFFLPRLLQSSFLKQYQEKEINYHTIFSRTLVFSLMIFLIMVVQYYTLINSSEDLSFFSTVVSASLVWGSGLIPISVSGLGVRENVAVFILGRFGISAATAVAASLLIFTINVLVPAMIGTIYIIKRRKTLKDAGSSIRTATKTIYDKINSRKNQ